MAYCTLALLADRFGTPLLIDLSHRDGPRPAAPDAALFDRAIADADALIDSYLKGRYQLPIVGDVPPVLTDLSLAIAIYRAHASVVAEKFRKDFEDAVKTLKDIASGAARLDVAGVEPTASGASGARITDRERPFTEDNLKGWWVMAAGLLIELGGTDEALGALARAADRLDHPAPLFDAIGALLVASTQRRFERGVDPDGKAWPPSLRVLLEGGRTLVDTGMLVASITHQPSDSGVVVGTNSIKAAAHQFGATIRPVTARALAFSIGGRSVFAGEVTMPRRAFLGLDEDDAQMIAEEAEGFVLGPLAPAEAGGVDAG